MVCTTAFFHLRQNLGRLSQLSLQEWVGFEKFITFPGCQFQITLHLIKVRDLVLSFAHLFCALFTELIVMRPQQGHLLKQNVILLCQQVYPLLALIGIYWVVTCIVRWWCICPKLLKHRNIDSSLFNQPQVLALLDLQVGHQFFILGHQLTMNLRLLRHCTLQHLNLFTQCCNVMLIFLDQGPDSVSAKQLRKAIIGQICCIIIFIRSSTVYNLIDLCLLTC